MGMNILLPEDDASPQKVSAWRWKVAGSLMVLWAFAAFQIGAMFVGVPKLGQLVWADGLKDKADKNEIAEVKASLNTLLVQQAQTAEALNESLAQAKAAEIRSVALKRCAAPANSAERESLTREIDRLQTEYKKIKGEPYDKPRCSEL